MGKPTKEYTLPEELTPRWIKAHHQGIKKQVQQSDLVLVCSALKDLGVFGSAFFAELQELSLTSKTKLVLKQLPDHLKKNLSQLSRSTSNSAEPKASPVPGLFEDLGQKGYNLREQVVAVLHLFSEALYWSSFGLLKKKSLLKGATLEQMVLLGSSALPIVLLLSFLIGLTLAIQSAVQLEQFGASIYLASGIGISMVTEIGPMMTAVILAGRSGSSITAEIATMVVQEELKALKSMAINPIHFILMPRFWAMTLTLPLLTACSALIGIFAGFLVSFFYLDIPTDLFLNELGSAVTTTMIWQSAIKSITFAWLISLISIFKGFSARGGADAVGKATTSCVVTCIFCIIMADAVFSFLFYF